MDENNDKTYLIRLSESEKCFLNMLIKSRISANIDNTNKSFTVMQSLNDDYYKEVQRLVKQRAKLRILLNKLE